MAVARIQTIEDLMTRNVHVVAPHTRLSTIARMLHDNQVTALPVLDPAGVVVGMVSGADIVARVAAGDLTGSETAATLMSRAPAAARPEMTAPAAIRLLVRHGLSQVVVVDGEDRLRGIVSLADLLGGEIGNYGSPPQERDP